MEPLSSSSLSSQSLGGFGGNPTSPTHVADEFIKSVMEKLKDDKVMAMSFLRSLKDFIENRNLTSLVTRVKERPEDLVNSFLNLIKTYEEAKTTLDEVFNELRNLLIDDPDLANEFSTLKILTLDHKSQSGGNSSFAQKEKRNIVMPISSRNSGVPSSSQSTGEGFQSDYTIYELDLLLECAELTKGELMTLWDKIRDNTINPESPIREDLLSEDALRCFRVSFGRDISGEIHNIRSDAAGTLPRLLDWFTQKTREWSGYRNKILNQKALPFKCSISDHRLHSGLFSRLLPPDSAQFEKGYAMLQETGNLLKATWFSAPYYQKMVMEHDRFLSPNLQEELMKPTSTKINDMCELKTLIESAEAAIRSASALYNKIPVQGQIDDHFTHLSLMCIKRIWGHRAIGLLKMIFDDTCDALPFIVSCLRLRQREWLRDYIIIKRASPLLLMCFLMKTVEQPTKKTIAEQMVSDETEELHKEKPREEDDAINPEVAAENKENDI